MPPQLDQTAGVGYASQEKSKVWSISPTRRLLVEADRRKELPIEIFLDHLPNPNNPPLSMVDKKLKTAIIPQDTGKERLQTSCQPRLVFHSPEKSLGDIDLLG